MGIPKDCSSVAVSKSKMVALNQNDDSKEDPNFSGCCHSHGECTKAKKPPFYDCVHAYHHTTDRSKLLVVVFELQSKYGGHAWYFQPRLLAYLLCVYGTLSETQDPDVTEAFMNMRAGPVPDSSGSNRQLITSLAPEISRQDEKGLLSYKHYHMYTTIDIPVHKLGYRLNEKIWIDITIKEIVHRMQDIFISTKFQVIYKKLADLNPFGDMTSDHRPKQHSTLPKYIKNASVRIHPVTSLTKHFTRPVAKSLSLQISNESLLHPKYDSAESVATGANRTSKEIPPQKICCKKRARHTEECSIEKTTEEYKIASDDNI